MARNPWTELTTNRPHITMRFAPLPGDLRGYYARRGGQAAILLAFGLKWPEVTATLAGLLAHDDSFRGVVPASDRLGGS